MDIENMSIEKATERCNQLTKPEHANWIGISNQIAIIRVLNELENLKEEKATAWEEWNNIDQYCDQEKQKCKAELEKKDLIINEMATTMSSLCTGLSVIREQFEKKYCEFINSDEDCCWKTDKECSDCIKEYFTNKVESEGK